MLRYIALGFLNNINTRNTVLIQIMLCIGILLKFFIKIKVSNVKFALKM